MLALFPWAALLRRVLSCWSLGHEWFLEVKSRRTPMTGGLVCGHCPATTTVADLHSTRALGRGFLAYMTGGGN